MQKVNIVECQRCLYDETIPMIEFDESGVCNYCRNHERLERQFPTGKEGEAIIGPILEQIKQEGKGKKYDCVIGVSGGCDSSYLVYQMVERGLRPLAVHYDNTWNSPIATQNIHNVLSHLKVDLDTYVVNNREMDDLYRAFMLSGVKELEAPTDIALLTTLYRAAAKHGVHYIIDGQSFRTEGATPPGWMYMDGGYIQDIHRRFGRRQMKTFPNLTLARFIRYTAFHSIKRIQPLFYIHYQKEEAKKFLSENLGWKWYGGHHLENRMTTFFHTYWLPVRFGLDFRLVNNSAMVRSGQMTRDEAKEVVRRPPDCDPELIDMVKKRLDLSDTEFDAVISSPHRSHLDYKTYRPAFAKLKLLFWLLYKQKKVPESFYRKFCEGKIQ